MADTASIDFSSFAKTADVHIISVPQQFEFAGGEQAYDEQIGGALRDDLLRCGRGAWKLATRYCARPIESILELGAGGGTCSLGLISCAAQATVLITDTSPVFLQIIRSKLVASGTPTDKVNFATLSGEDMYKLGDQNIDAIFIASALHHVSDWREFLRDAAKVIRPGGVLVIQEPCREGNLMMGMALDIALSPLWPKEARFTEADLSAIVRCRESIFHLANSHIPKEGEDKHSFLATELTAGGHEAGFSSSFFYSNFHFADLVDHDLNRLQGTCSFVDYLNSFLEFHHKVTADGLSKLRRHLYPALRSVDEIFTQGDGAPMLGCMVFCK